MGNRQKIGRHCDWFLGISSSIGLLSGTVPHDENDLLADGTDEDGRALKVYPDVGSLRLLREFIC